MNNKEAAMSFCQRLIDSVVDAIHAAVCEGDIATLEFSPACEHAVFVSGGETVEVDKDLISKIYYSIHDKKLITIQISAKSGEAAADSLKKIKESCTYKESKEWRDADSSEN
jgi:hypothetical protein